MYIRRKFSDYLYEKKFKLIDFNEQNEEAEEKAKEKESDKKDDKEDSPEDEHKKRIKDLTHDHHEDDEDDEDDEDHHHKKKKKEKEEEHDPDREGVIRTIKNAHLIYKRQDSNGTYSELWMYDISKGSKDEFDVRNAILDGTDIDQKTGSSEDGKEHYELWTCNTRQMMLITGLAN